MTDFEAALKALNQAGVSFVIVGAYAAVAHGSAYVTRDLDICYERSPENLQRLAASLKQYHPRLREAPPGLPFMLDAQTLQRGLNFTLSTDVGDLDILGEISGIGQFPQVAAGAETISLYGISCKVASLEVIIASKRAAGRPKDLNALAELQALRELKTAHKKS